MSRVEVTDLVPGTVALSDDVNATLTSWVDATDAGSITTDNLRVEAIDRRTLSAAAQVVYTAASGTFTRVVGNSGAVQNIAGFPVVVPGPLETDVLVYPGDVLHPQYTIVHASLYMEGTANSAATAMSVTLSLQVSTNGGGTWTTIPGTTQVYQLRATGDLCDPAGGPPDFPAIATSASWSAYYQTTGPSYMFRVAYETAVSTELITFINGTIFTETFNL